MENFLSYLGDLLVSLSHLLVSAVPFAAVFVAASIAVGFVQLFIAQLVISAKNKREVAAWESSRVPETFAIDTTKVHPDVLNRMLKPTKGVR